MERDYLDIPEEVVALGVGPNKVVKTYFRFIINRFKFHTKSHEEKGMSQSSCVVNTSEVGSVNCYGRLRDIIMLDYYGKFEVVLVKCDWVNAHYNICIWLIEFWLALVNFPRIIHTDEKFEHDPYVFLSQVE